MLKITLTGMIPDYRLFIMLKITITRLIPDHRSEKISQVKILDNDHLIRSGSVISAVVN